MKPRMIGLLDFSEYQVQGNLPCYLEIYVPLLYGISRELRVNNCMLRMISTGDELERHANFERFDGYLGLFQNLSEDRRAVLRSIASRSPLCFLLIERPWDGCNYVSLDEGHAMRLLIEHLYGQGCIRIGFYYVPDQPRLPFWAAERFRAYKDALRIFGLPFRSDLTVGISQEKEFEQLDLRSDPLKFQKVFSLYRNRLGNLDAVVCANDIIADSFVERAWSVGIRIPEDLCVTGFNDNYTLLNNENANFITTIRQDFCALGEMGVKMLHDIISGKRPDGNQQALLDGELIVRESSMRAIGPGDPVAPE